MRAQDLADAVTSHPRPNVDVEMRKKALPSAPIVGVFGPPIKEICICASGSDGVLGGHKGLYWFGRNVPTSSLLLLVLPTLGLQ